MDLFLLILSNPCLDDHDVSHDRPWSYPIFLCIAKGCLSSLYEIAVFQFYINPNISAAADSQYSTQTIVIQWEQTKMVLNHLSNKTLSCSSKGTTWDCEKVLLPILRMYAHNLIFGFFLWSLLLSFQDSFKVKILMPLISNLQKLSSLLQR